MVKLIATMASLDILSLSFDFSHPYCSIQLNFLSMFFFFIQFKVNNSSIHSIDIFRYFSVRRYISPRRIFIIEFAFDNISAPLFCSD